MKGSVLKNNEDVWIFRYKKEDKPFFYELPLMIEGLNLDNLDISQEVDCEIITQKVVDDSDCECKKTPKPDCENIVYTGIKECTKIKYKTKEFAKISSNEIETWNDLYSLFWTETKKSRETEQDIVNGLIDFPIWLSENYSIPKRKN